MTEMIKTGRSIWGGGEGIAANSLSVTNGRLLSKVGGFVVAATDATGEIIGVTAGDQSFPANNQTVGKNRIEYIAADDHARIKIAIVGGAVAQADEGKLYDLTSAGLVDGTSAGGEQVKLEKFVSATVGIFSVVR